MKEEIAFRMELPRYRRRFAELQIERTREGICLEVADQGDGFEWKKYLEFDPERTFDLHGRGIATARTFCLDEVTYLGKGNRVRVFLRTPEAPWALPAELHDMFGAN